MKEMKLSHRNSGVNTAVASEKNINIEQHEHIGYLWQVFLFVLSLHS